MPDVEEVLKKVQEAAINYLTGLIQPKELIDACVSLSFEDGVLNVEVEVSLHETSLKKPTEIAKQVAQYALDLFDNIWREGLEGGSLNKDGKKGRENSHNQPPEQRR